MQTKLTALLTALLVWAPAQGSAMKKLVPGKSLHDVSLDEAQASLVKKGFVTDETRGPGYLKRDDLLIRLEKEKAAQIWFEGQDLGSLSLRGKKFPAKNDEKTLRKFLKKCERSVTGSGGTLIYCENQGLELSYDMSGHFEGLSVLTPAVAAQTKSDIKAP